MDRSPAGSTSSAPKDMSCERSVMTTSPGASSSITTVRGAVPESAAPPGTQKEKEFYSAVPTQQLTP